MCGVFEEDPLLTWEEYSRDDLCWKEVHENLGCAEAVPTSSLELGETNHYEEEGDPRLSWKPLVGELGMVLRSRFQGRKLYLIGRMLD